MLGRATANLVITDKRTDGYPTAHAWGLDWPMADLDRTQPTASPFQNGASSVPEWQLTNVKAIGELNAAILACRAGSSDMVLTQWNQDTSTYWKIVQPFGRARKWIKWYDASPNQTGKLTWNTRWTTNPTWRFTFMRTQPPVSQTDPVFFRITLNALGTVRYRVYIPQLWDEGAGATQPDSYYPLLQKSEDAGASWTTVDQFMTEEASQWARNAFERVEYLYCRFVPNHLVLSLGEQSRHWIYYEEGLEIPEGHVSIEVGGGQLAFHIKQALFMTSGTIERLIGIVPPDYINPADDDTDYLGDVSAGPGCGITVAMQSGGGEVWPKATLLSTGYHTPVLYEIQATRPAIHGGVVADVLFDNESIVGDEHKLLELEYTIAQDWRGSSATARIRTVAGADEYALTGNEKVQLAVKLDTGNPADPWYTVFTGFLETPKYPKDPRSPGELILDISARDRLVRLDQKRARDLPAFDGWDFDSAFRWVLHEAGAVPDAEILLDDDAAGFVFPTRLGELNYRFDATARLVDVLDSLAKTAGRQWGINTLGQVFTRALGTTGYSGVPDFTIDESLTGDEDQVYLLELDRDLFMARNHVLVIGRDPDTGAEIRAMWRHTNSLSDPNADPFIGDDWWEVSIAAEGENPWVKAAFLGEQLSQYRCLLVWQTNGKPHLRPDHCGPVTASKLAIPAATVFRIIEAHGRLHGEGEFISHFALVPA